MHNAVKCVHAHVPVRSLPLWLAHLSGFRSAPTGAPAPVRLIASSSLAAACRGQLLLVTGTKAAPTYPNASSDPTAHPPDSIAASL